jgi:hypothetical protein
MIDEKCEWIFGCEYTPSLVVRTGTHNDPKPMCREHAMKTSESLRKQGYYAFLTPIDEENGLHPQHDPNSGYNRRRQAELDNTDRWVIRCSSFDDAAKYAAVQDWALREWTWLPAYTVHKTIQIFERIT